VVFAVASGQRALFFRLPGELRVAGAALHLWERTPGHRALVDRILALTDRGEPIPVREFNAIDDARGDDLVDAVEFAAFYAHEMAEMAQWRIPEVERHERALRRATARIERANRA
jgi:hypothetical protein